VKRSTSSPRADKRDNRRGSREAVEKRRAARQFNDLLLGGGGARRLDGRTEKRRQRMLAELKEGHARSSKQPLKPIDVLCRIQALLDLDEPLAALRKVCPAPRGVEITDHVVLGLTRLHEAYAFRPEAYAFVGIDDAALRRAGILGPQARPGPARTGPKKPSAARARGRAA
jgi:hypothetical protein